MKIKQLIYNIFFKKKNKRTGQNKNNEIHTGNGSNNRNKATRDDSTNKETLGNKYDLSELRQRVEETEYIQNLRIGRSWILPQLIKMGVVKKRRNYIFDIEQYEEAIHTKYNASVTGRNKVWSLILRNYKDISDSNGMSKRAKWWTTDVFKKFLIWDFSLVGRNYCGLNREGCINIIKTMHDLSDHSQIYNALVKYNEYRMEKRKARHNNKLPYEFIDSYMGDGAYNAMMTMVKIYNIRLKNESGLPMTRDECISEIERQASRMNGKELLEYCKKMFFDSGAFDLSSYFGSNR